MAALMGMPSCRVIFQNVARLAQVSSIRSIRQESRSNRHANIDERDDWVVLAEGGSTIVCWHPEPQFPYECTQPLPVARVDSHSVLKTQLKDDVMSVFHKKPDAVLRKELMQLTYTTKHRWFPHGEKKFAKKTKPDREFL